MGKTGAEGNENYGDYECRRYQTPIKAAPMTPAESPS
jgi:hypothetical protein